MAAVPKWSATKIKIASECLQKYKLIYVDKIKPVTKADIALGLFLHRAIEKIFKDGKLRYKSAESYANAMGAQWVVTVVKPGMIQGRKIEWKDDKEPWILKHKIKEICKNIHERYAREYEEGIMPLAQEVHFEFEFGGRRFEGYIDEIRPQATIRDHKSTECHNSEFAQVVGVSERNNTKPLDLLEIINLEYYSLQDNEVINVARRTPKHYHALVDMLQGLEKNIIDGNFYPRYGSHCKYCQVAHACLPRQQEYEKQIFLYDIPVLGTRNKEPGEKQLRLKFPRKKAKRAGEKVRA